MLDNIYELIFDPEDNDKGVYSISLVETPAIGIMALSFSKEEKVINWKLSSEDKRIIVSPILIPNQKIYRNNISDTGEGYVFVSEGTIEQLQQNFFKNNFGHNSSIEHLHIIEDGVYVFESWIIEDPNNDKANALGFKDLPKGTWMVSLKIENDSVWNNYVKTGKIGGISMDALLQPVKVNKLINKEIKFNKQMKKGNLKEAFKKAFTKVMFTEDRKEFKISDELSVYADSLELGSSVYNAEGDLMVDVEFEYDGKLYEVNAEGMIESIEDINVEDPQLDFEFSEEEIEAIVEEIKEEMIVDYEAEMAKLNERIAELEAELEVFKKVDEELVELKKQTPARKGIRTSFSKDSKPVNGVLGAMRTSK